MIDCIQLTVKDVKMGRCDRCGEEEQATGIVRVRYPGACQSGLVTEERKQKCCEHCAEELFGRISDVVELMLSERSG